MSTIDELIAALEDPAITRRQDRLEAATLLRQFRELGFIDEKGEARKVEKMYWRADCDEGDACEELDDIADSMGDGEMFEVTPILILPNELYVASVNQDGTGDYRPATSEERQRFSDMQADWKRRANRLPNTPEAAAAAKEASK